MSSSRNSMDQDGSFKPRIVETLETSKPHVVETSGQEDNSENGNISSPSSSGPEPKTFTGRPPLSLPREIAFVLVVCMAQLMTLAGLGQTIAPLRIIGKSFGTDDNPTQLLWFPAAFSLTSGTFILIAGRLGDLYGHKRLFIAGFFWFGVWSVLAGFAVYSGPVLFICCRAFQGIGPAFLLPNGLAILGTTYEPGLRKALVFSAFGAMAPTGFVVGAVFAALFADLVWWPWAFWAMGMFCFLFGVASIFLIPNNRLSPPIDNLRSIWAKADIAGGLTGVSGLVLVNFAWNQAPTVGWSDPYVYVLLIVGFILLVIFGQIEKRAAFPLVPIASMTADIGFIFGSLACGWLTFIIWVYYTWQFIEMLRGVSPLIGTAQLAPATVCGFLASLTTGLLFTRVPGSVIMMISLAMFCTGPILLATAPVNQTYWAQTFVAICLMPFGMEMSFPAATLLLSNAMPQEHQGLSGSLVATVVNYSISLGLGLAGTVEVHVNDGGKDILRGYRGAWYLAIGLSALGIILAVFYGLHEHWKPKRVEMGVEFEIGVRE